MKLAIRRLFDIPGEVENFSGSLDLSWIERRGGHPFQTPVIVKGSAENHTGILTLSYTASFQLSMTCDRCLKELDKELHYSFRHTLVREINSEGEDDYILAPDGIIDISEIAATDIQLELPARFICSQDCKGLCTVCGANLNERDCGCQKNTVDPRLEVLRKLL